MYILLPSRVERFRRMILNQSFAELRNCLSELGGAFAVLYFVAACGKDINIVETARELAETF